MYTALVMASVERWSGRATISSGCSTPRHIRPVTRDSYQERQLYSEGLKMRVQERGERYRERVAGVSEKVVDHWESMEADEILSRSSQVEKIDTVARRTFGLDDTASGNGAVNLNVLWGGRAIVQVNQKNE